MELKEFLLVNGVEIIKSSRWMSYSNCVSVENVIGKEVWICEYLCSGDFSKKAV